jgi:hypothetical protein
VPEVVEDDQRVGDREARLWDAEVVGRGVREPF